MDAETRFRLLCRLAHCARRTVLSLESALVASRPHYTAVRSSSRLPLSKTCSMLLSFLMIDRLFSKCSAQNHARPIRDALMTASSRA